MAPASILVAESVGSSSVGLVVDPFGLGLGL